MRYGLTFGLSGPRWHLPGLSELPLEQRLLVQYYLPERDILLFFHPVFLDYPSLSHFFVIRGSFFFNDIKSTN